MTEEKKDPQLDALSRAVNRRKTAMAKLKKGEKPGTVSERRLRKLIKQAQRRKKRLLADRAKKPKGKEAPAEASA